MVKNKKHFFIFFLFSSLLSLIYFFTIANIIFADATTEPLIQASDVQFIGAFRLPGGQLGPGEFDTFAYAIANGASIAYDPSRNGLFLSGHTYGVEIAEVGIPAIVNSTDLNALNTASLLQPFKDASEGKKDQVFTDALGYPIVSSLKTNGLMVLNNKLYGDYFLYYDGGGAQAVSHYVRPTDLSVTGQVSGMHAFGVGQQGNVSGPMAPIPSEWQSLLGGDALTGQYGIPVVSRTSWGPSAFSFYTANEGTINPVPINPLLFYNTTHHTLGDWTDSGTLWNSDDGNGGFVFIPGTRSVIFFINHGIGQFCYSVNGCPPYGDRTTAWPYVPMAYAYDANDFVAVKNGQKNPWDLLPYTTWAMGPQNEFGPAGATYDPVSKRIYLLVSGDGDHGYVKVYQVGTGSVSPSPTPTPPPPTPTPTPTPPPPQPSPTPTPPPSGGSVVNVSNVSQLQSAVSNLISGQTIIIAPGIYNVTQALGLPQGISNVTIKGSTGNRNDIIISGHGMSGDILFGFWVGNVQNPVFSDMTIQGFADDCIIFNQGAESPRMSNIHCLDAGQQLIKVNPSNINNGILENSLIEYSTVALNSYTNGIDVHGADGWIIRNNTFKNIKADTNVGSPECGPAVCGELRVLAGPAVLFWGASTNSTVINNIFIDNQRDISFGLRQGSGYNDHSGGLIANNMLVHNSIPVGGLDVPIGLMDSPNTKVYYNTILTRGGYPNAIEYRFSTTNNIDIRNNLVDAVISSRDGGSGNVSNNITNAATSLFVNLGTGDLHLKSSIGQAVAVSVITDFDGQSRSGSLDLGADQFSSGGGNPTPVIGDINNDHIVNSLDWSLMNTKWFKSDANADLNHDGIVNSIDFSLLNANWFKTW